MNILYAGAIQTNAGWGAECFLNAALLEAGHTTYLVDYRIARNRLAGVLSDIPKFDFFLLQRGDYFPLSAVSAIRRPRIFYFSELVLRRHDADHLFRSNLFDHYLVRGESCRQRIISLGWVPLDRISIYLSAFDPSLYYPQHREPEIDVLFVGTLTSRRQRLLDDLSSRFQIRHYSVYGSEAAKLYNHARIVLNLHAEDFLDTETRVFEVLGSKAFLISEPLAEESPFRSGVHLVEAETQQELEEKIAYYLDHPDEREEIAGAGYEEAIARHTYTARVGELFKVIEPVLRCSVSDGPSIDAKALASLSCTESMTRTRIRLARDLASAKSIILGSVKK